MNTPEEIAEWVTREYPHIPIPPERLKRVIQERVIHAIRMERQRSTVNADSSGPPPPSDATIAAGVGTATYTPHYWWAVEREIAVQDAALFAQLVTWQQKNNTLRLECDARGWRLVMNLSLLIPLVTPGLVGFTTSYCDTPQDAIRAALEVVQP